MLFLCNFSVEDIVSLIDNVAMQLTNGFHDRTLQMNVISMCNHLKLYANQLEAIYKGEQNPNILESDLI